MSKGKGIPKLGLITTHLYFSNNESTQLLHAYQLDYSTNWYGTILPVGVEQAFTGMKAVTPLIGLPSTGIAGNTEAPFSYFKMSGEPC
jgi:hypothetical protein